MTPKQTRFVEEYLIDLNATKAYQRAGYQAKNDNVAGVEAHKLLKNPKIAYAIEEAKKKRSERTELTQDYVLTRLRELAEKAEGLRPVRMSIKIAETEDGAPVFIEAEQTVFKPEAAKGAYELLGKHLELFTDKVKHDAESDLLKALGVAAPPHRALAPRTDLGDEHTRH